MTNPFSLSDDELQTLLNSYAAWCQSNAEEGRYAEEHEQRAREIKSTLLNEDYLSETSNGQLAEKVMQYSRGLEGPAHIRLGSPRISEEVENIRRNLLYLIQSSDDPFRKAAELLEGKFRIPMFAKAFWSPILQAQFPDKLPNWNNKTERFLKKVGVDLTTAQLSTEDKYRLLSNAFSYLRGLDTRLSFHHINHLMHYGTVIDEGVELIEKLIEQMKDGDDFGRLAKHKDFESWIQDYVQARASGDKKEWNEEYKWKILPALREEAFGSVIKSENIVETVEALRRNNPPKGSFVHWSNLGDLRRVAQKNPERLAQILNQLFEDTAPLSVRIDGGIAACREILPGARLGTPLFGYLLAAYDPARYPVYKGSVFDQVTAVIDPNKKWKSLSIGMKYEKFQRLSFAMGKYLAEAGKLTDVTRRDIPVQAGITALDGQDFFYILTHRLKSKPHPEPTQKDDKLTSKAKLLQEIFLDEQRFDDIVGLLEISRKKQIILQGPPGTGKTFIGTRIAQYLTNGEGRVETIQFHPSFSYEDFIEGYRPNDDGTFELRWGIFKAFCERARSDAGETFVLVIDEINRGNLSKIFGELLYLLEYRDQGVRLTYSSEYFSIPANLCLIGTMNTADRSLAIMDYALRRRFYFVDLKCETKRLEKWLTQNNCQVSVAGLIGKIENMNRAIESEMRSKEFAVGHSYFMKENLDFPGIRKIIAFEVRPLLKEYFFDKKGTVEQILAEFEEYGSQH